jgi:hypothetical protein
MNLDFRPWRKPYFPAVGRDNIRGLGNAGAASADD